MGAYLGTVAPHAGDHQCGKNIVSIYRTPLIEVATQCVFTNTHRSCAYRGAGRPEGNYFMERLIDTAAREMGNRPAGAAPAQPDQARGNCRTPPPSDLTYDCGDFPARVQAGAGARRLGGLCGAQARQPASAASCAASASAAIWKSPAPPNKEMGGIRFEADGTVTVYHRHAGLRPGPCDPVRANAVEPARRAVRPRPPDAGRQRRTDHRRRHRRLAFRHGGAAPRSVEAAAKVVERGKQARLPCAGSRRGGHRIRARPLRHRRHRPLDRRHRTRRQAARRSQAAATMRRNRST